MRSIHRPDALLTLAYVTTLFAAGVQAAPLQDDTLADIRAQVASRHDEALKRLQEWIALPSIAAEDRNFPAGAERMAELAREAGFQQVTVVDTDR